MKRLFIVLIFAVLLAAACQTDPVKSFIPGTYTDSAEGEFSVAFDTLEIRAEESNNFRIRRRTGFRRIINGKPGKWEYEIEQWNAVYDEATKTVQETRRGKVLTFFPDSGKLMVGKRSYRKTLD